MEQGDPRAVLDALVQRHGESYAGLSRMLGRNVAYLQQFVRRGSPRVLPERDRRLLAEYFRVDEQALGAPAPPASALVGVVVPRIDATVAAGAGAFADDARTAGGQLIDPRLIRALGVRPDNLSIVTAQGESMRPTLLPGDELLVDGGDRRIATRSAIFVLRAQGLLMVKRVARTLGRLVITSDNPAFPGVDPDGVEVLGRVVWLARMLAH